MIYKHKYFILDDEKRQIYDEFGRKAKISGKPYLTLLKLCQENRPITVTEIGDFIDPVADLDEENIRQYCHKISTALYYDVIKYKNQRYFIDGEIKKYQSWEEMLATHGPLPVPEHITAQKIIKAKLKSLIKNKYFILFAALLLTLMLILFGRFLIWHKMVLWFASKPVDDMVLIPGGEFLMGSTEEEIQNIFQMCKKEEGECDIDDYRSSYPQKKIYLGDFYIDKKEVSHKDYAMFLKATKRPPPLYWTDSTLNSDNQPVVGVSWDDAMAYCKWLGKRLPTEAEWEKAARGTDGRLWSWGNEWDGNKTNHGQRGLPGYDESDGYRYSAPVGVELGVSPYGILNITGNVAEWVADEFAPYEGNDKFTNKNYNQGFKVMRGGSYIYTMADLTIPVRAYEQATFQADDLGFRCAKDK